MADRTEGRWLLLIHQIPPKPSYFRVKIWRRLQRLGAVAIKNSVYVLPKSDQAQEDFQWVLREILEGGGDASICEARFVEGLDDDQVEALFHAARDAEYAQVAEALRSLIESIPNSLSIGDERRTEFEVHLVRLKRRLADVVAVDFFGSPGREDAESLLAAFEAKLIPARRQPATAVSPGSLHSIKDFRDRTWVTRKGIHVDRIASAWLIRRFIDPDARFRFVPATGYRSERNEVRFDMFEAEFTHEGDRCTFEVLIERMGLEDPALRSIAEIVHDIDLKDSKFGRQEVPGLDRLIAGIAMAHKEDETRLSRGLAVLDDLYEYFKRKCR